MKIELTDEQRSLILDALDALADAAENEKCATNDSEVLESNDAVLRDAAALYEYIANYKEGE